MWGGRFECAPDKLMEDINASIDFDQRLAAQDIRGSQAHCRMLVQQGILKPGEGEQILEGLEKVREEIFSGDFQFRKDLEDIHMNVENRLREIIGEVAGKLHTARSRNDQVATDFKLWTRDAIDQCSSELEKLIRTLITVAKEHTETILPGFTHLQNAQPVSLAHHLLAYVEMFKRDLSRFQDARNRLNECPLGSAALAGTVYEIDRELTSVALDFDRPTRNSLDSVSDRDFALEFLFCAQSQGLHLSRLAEELVLWSSYQFQFVKLPDNFTTGSSIMPQKKNPDAAELIRAKVGRILASLQSLSFTMKALPLAYSKDMQEDKEVVFDAFDQLMLCVRAMTGMIEGARFQTENMLKSAQVGYPTATDLADYLVEKLAYAFRDAHHLAAKAVALAEQRGCQLEELELSSLQNLEAGIEEDVFSILTLQSSLNRRNSYGGTAPAQVRAQIQLLEKEFAL